MLEVKTSVVLSGQLLLFLINSEVRRIMGGVMPKSFYASLLLGAFLIVSAVPVSAGVIQDTFTTTSSFEIEKTSNNQTITGVFDKFDSSEGTLIGVSITYDTLWGHTTSVGGVK